MTGQSWSSRSAFVPVFVFAGVTVLDALPEPRDAWGRAAAATHGRPATADVPGWILPVTLAVFLTALAPLGTAWWRDAGERRAAAGPAATP